MATLNGLALKVSNVMGKVQRKGLLDTCTIYSSSPTQDAGGGSVKGTSEKIFIDIPVIYRFNQQEKRGTDGGKEKSINECLLRIPTQTLDNFPVNIDILNCRIEIDARGDRPLKVCRPLAKGDKVGVLTDIICKVEN